MMLDTKQIGESNRAVNTNNQESYSGINMTKMAVTSALLAILGGCENLPEKSEKDWNPVSIDDSNTYIANVWGEGLSYGDNGSELEYQAGLSDVNGAGYLEKLPKIVRNKPLSLSYNVTLDEELLQSDSIKLVGLCAQSCIRSKSDTELGWSLNPYIKDQKLFMRMIHNTNGVYQNTDVSEFFQTGDKRSFGKIQANIPTNIDIEVIEDKLSVYINNRPVFSDTDNILIKYPVTTINNSIITGDNSRGFLHIENKTISIKNNLK